MAGVLRLFCLRIENGADLILQSGLRMRKLVIANTSSLISLWAGLLIFSNILFPSITFAGNHVSSGRTRVGVSWHDIGQYVIKELDTGWRAFKEYFDGGAVLSKTMEDCYGQVSGYVSAPRVEGVRSLTKDFNAKRLLQQSSEISGGLDEYGQRGLSALRQVYEVGISAAKNNEWIRGVLSSVLGGDVERNSLRRF